MKLLKTSLWIKILMSNYFVSGFDPDAAEMPDIIMSVSDVNTYGFDPDAAERPDILTSVSDVERLTSGLSYISESDTVQTDFQCASEIKTFNERLHKKTVYRVGVEASRGYDEAFQEYNKTYGEYLSLTAGKRFDPPIHFEMVPMTFQELFDAAETKEVDFFLGSAAVYSCMETEVGAEPVVTTISRLEARGHVYDLDVYGGVIVTQKDNEDIVTIKDLKDKIVAAVSINSLMDGQMQFAEMELAGLSYLMDPKQVVFTGDQFDVVNGVLDGEFDVGFVSTDTIERTKDRNGNPIDPTMFKVIEPKIHILDDGKLFPFIHSTPVFPEWPFSALTHVPSDIAKEVQRALLDFGKDAENGRLYEKCLYESDETHCESLLCDTARDVVLLAREASIRSQVSGYRTSGSYSGIRSMQQAAGFMTKGKKGEWMCTRASDVYEGINCPEGHFKVKRKAFDDACGLKGLECKEGYDCFCDPCVKANDVDVYPYDHSEEDLRVAGLYLGQDQIGCEKMSVCGFAQQTQTMTMRIYDNREEATRQFKVQSLRGRITEEIEVHRIPGTFAYQLHVTSTVIGYNIISIFMDGEQIFTSPILMQVTDRECAAEFPGEGKVASLKGECICSKKDIEIRGRCVSSALVFAVIAAAVFLVALQIGFIYLSHKRRLADNLWHVNVDELQFSEPVEIIGQGSFGVVLLAEYRGTKVAVKRVLPLRDQRKRGGSDSKLKADGTFDDGLKDDLDLEVQSMENSNEILNSVDIGGTGTFRSWSLSFRKNNGRLAQLFPWLFGPNEMDFGSNNILMGSSFGSSSTGALGYYFSCFDKNAQQKRDFIAEMRLLSRLRHPCITTVMGAVISPLVEPMLVMEYMDYGSLYDLLRNETMYTGGEVILQIVRDITQGLRYLHASKPPILHGDLKAKNILVDSRFRAKVGDFGLSIKKTNGIHGTPYWMAPEYLKRKAEYNEKCDMYSFGMVLYEIYARKNPYAGENPRRVLRKVCHPRINKRPDIPLACPPKMADIMKKCWSHDSYSRPTSQDLDVLFVDMNMQDVEPLCQEQQGINPKLKEGKTTKELLYDVFPKHIADALNQGKKVEPESHEMVTVVFSDIVGFTSISKEYSPLKISNMLDRLYLAFDSLARTHGVFKVETIGDAYMGVTNLNESQKDDHTKRIAEFAMDLVEAAGKIPVDEESPDKGFIHVRVGFHSGPVVSNVIGSLNPRYGLFGDTVNTASRMETNSSANRILCSQRAATLLKQQANDIPVTKRGKVGVKGKGNMVTYWVGDSNPINIAYEPVQREAKKVVFAPEEVMPENPNGPSEGDENVAQEKRIVQSNPATEVNPKTPTPDEADHSGSTHDPVFSDGQDNEEGDETDHSISSLQAMYSEEKDIEAMDSDGLLDWMVQILSDHIKKVVASRKATITDEGDLDGGLIHAMPRTAVWEEVTSIISMPVFNPVATAATGNHNSIEISPSVQAQLKEFVTLVKSGYKSNEFHNFTHACHVTVSLHKLLQPILAPARTQGKALHLHEISYGISSNPMALFALVFSTLIHDVDHRGVSNLQLAKEEPIMASRYGNKSIAEQNSFDITWDLLMFKQFDELRKFIFGSHEELLRFRQLVVNIVMATDIFNKESNERRKQRWQQAFNEQNSFSKSDKDLNDLRASLVLEQLIQAADVSHTMQHWCVYQKWNRQLFEEMFGAYRKGRVGVNPANFWYQGELNFLDSYIIPMAKRLKECNMFDTISDDCMNYAVSNRAKWAICGHDFVKQMVEAFQE